MRAKRVRAIVAGAVVTAPERRLLKRQFYDERRARAGGSTRASALPPSGKMPQANWHHSTPRYQPTHEIGAFFSELSRIGKKLAMQLWSGRSDYRGSPIPGTGLASRLPRPELLRRIQALKGYVGIDQTVKV